MGLPDDTKIYCGHEYTKANAEFCLTVEPDNEALHKRYDQIKEQLSRGEPTIPTIMAKEKETNAFLRAGSASRFSDIRIKKNNA